MFGLKRLMYTMFSKPVSQSPWQWQNRYEYQKKLIDFQIGISDKVLDVGSGSDPFPLATHLCDRFIEPTHHRHTAIVTDARPFKIGDVELLPYQDDEFDFVYCCHVLEHVEDPIAACRELQRVAKRGYIETPAPTKDLMMSWARGMHKWGVVARGNSLIFLEYTERELDGMRSSLLGRLVHSATTNDFQKLFFENQDVLNTMFLWERPFRVEVFENNGVEPRVLNPSH